MGIVLASASPRRRELLEMIGLRDFKIIPDNSNESVPADLSPEDTVCSIALQKAENVSQYCDPDDIIIAADTLVYLEQTPVGKPADKDDAAAMLSMLSGKSHRVYTGVAVMQSDKHDVRSMMTTVTFRKMTKQDILSYIATGEPLDKAGAYGAQGKGSIFIERIDGDFYNVMGLPLSLLSVMLKEFDIDILPIVLDGEAL